MKFDTHKFLYTLFDGENIKGHSILYLNKDNKDELIKIEKIEIGASPVSCRIYDIKNKKYVIPFLRIKKIFLGETMVWENTDFNITDTKIIKGYK